MMMAAEVCTRWHDDGEGHGMGGENDGMMSMVAWVVSMAKDTDGV